MEPPYLKKKLSYWCNGSDKESKDNYRDPTLNH